ncbi:MAG: hypothetical protein QOH66_358, partial [Actinomycetota bacterium]|nr:hypothetical protein [Actinomycetota bacterium]
MSNATDPARREDPRGADRSDLTIPYVHGRHLVPIRRHRTRYVNVHHQRLFDAEDAVRARIHEVDQQLADLSVERKRLLTEIRTIHDEL